MALVKCFDPEGNEHQKETVDARECVSVLGWTMEKIEPKPLTVEKEQTEVVEDTRKAKK